MKVKPFTLILAVFLATTITSVFAQDDEDLVFIDENNNEDSLDIGDFVFVDENDLKNECNQLPINELHHDEIEVKNEVVSVSSVGYAACRGLITYGGKTFAVWLAGSNPATATVLVIGLVGSQVAGYGFDRVSDYLRSQDIPPPAPLTDEEIEAIIANEFVHMTDNIELTPEDEEVLRIVYEPELVRPEPTYLQRFARYTYNTGVDVYDRGVEITGNLIEGLPRMGATVIPGTLAGMVMQLVGGNIGSVIANAAVNNIAGQVYDANVTVINRENLEVNVIQNNDNIDDTPPSVEIHDEFFNVVILDDYQPLVLAQEEENLNNLLLDRNAINLLPQTAPRSGLLSLFGWGSH